MNQNSFEQMWFISRRQGQTLAADRHAPLSTVQPIRSRVQKFPAWHTKAAPNRKCCEGYISAIYGEVNVSAEKRVEIKGDYVEK